MIAARIVTALLAGATTVATATAGWLLFARPGRGAAPAENSIGIAAEAAAAPRLSADSLAAAASARDPFRLSREPAPMPFDPSAGGDVPPPPAAPRPPLVLVGIALGAERAALIDGLPGTESTRVLRVGESVAGYTVRRIEETHVRITGPDTTWTLVVREGRP